MAIFRKNTLEFSTILLKNSYQCCGNYNYFKFPLSSCCNGFNNNVIKVLFGTISKNIVDDEEINKEFQINQPVKDGKTKKYLSPYITLINLDGSRCNTFLHKAQKIAKHNGLELIHDSEKAIYKLVKVSSLIDSSVKSQAQKKSKKLVIKSNISDHDLQYKINQTIKNLAKGVEIVVQIHKVSVEKSIESVSNHIETKLGSDYKIKKLNNRTNSITLIITPKSENNEIQQS